VRTPRSGLTSLRLIFGAFVASTFLFGYVLTFMTGGTNEKDPGFWPWVVAGAGLYSVGGVLWSRRRKLDTSSPTRLAASYSAYWFTQMAFAQLSGLMGFVGAIITGLWWIFAEGLAFSIVGWILIAPTDGAVRRKDEELAAMGVPFSLSDALRDAPPRRPD